MKETRLHKKDEVKAVAEIPAEAQEVFQGRQRIRPGQKCFKIDGKTFDVSEASYEVEAVKFEEAAVNMEAPKRKILMEKGFWYVVALNQKNALRKLLKMQQQMVQAREHFEPTEHEVLS